MTPPLSFKCIFLWYVNSHLGATVWPMCRCVRDVFSFSALLKDISDSQLPASQSDCRLAICNRSLFFAVLCVKVIHTKGFNGGRLSWPMEHLTARVLRCFSLWTCVRASWHQISFSKPSSFLHFFSSWLTIFLVTFFSFSLLFVFFSLPPLFLSTTSFFLESLNPKSVNSCDGVASV